jgi:hypothetical protein
VQQLFKVKSKFNKISIQKIQTIKKITGHVVNKFILETNLAFKTKLSTFKVKKARLINNLLINYAIWTG